MKEPPQLNAYDWLKQWLLANLHLAGDKQAKIRDIINEPMFYDDISSVQYVLRDLFKLQEIDNYHDYYIVKCDNYYLRIEQGRKSVNIDFVTPRNVVVFED